MRIGVYVAGRGCPTLARECVDSLRSQTFRDFVACVTIDGQDDRPTFDAALGAARADGRICVNWMTRVHSCKAKLTAITALIEGFGGLTDDDILVGLDLDDRLLPNALQKIHDVHTAGAWVTYGNWIDQNANTGKEFRPMSPDRWEKVRILPWFMTAPNSLRVRVFRAIPDEQFRWYDGRGYYETGFDGSVMYGAADLAGIDRIVGIKDPIYVYNRDRPTNVLQAWPQAHRVKLFDEQRGKPRLDRLESSARPDGSACVKFPRKEGVE